MSKKCKICGANCYGEYCMKHKPKKPLKRTPLRDVKAIDRIVKDVVNSHRLQEFFWTIWNKRVHRCESCNTHLGNEPRTYMFDHLLEKSKYPDLKFEELNIFLCCFDCHTKKTNGFPTKEHKEAINKIKQLYGI